MKTRKPTRAVSFQADLDKIEELDILAEELTNQEGTKHNRSDILKKFFMIGERAFKLGVRNGNDLNEMERQLHLYQANQKLLENSENILEENQRLFKENVRLKKMNRGLKEGQSTKEEKPEITLKQAESMLDVLLGIGSNSTDS